jgi:hypothetical protein
MDARDALERIINWAMRDAKWLAKYSCEVQLQHDDDTVDVLVDDPALRANGYSRVTIEHGIPGVRVRVLQGSRCLLGFKGGKESAPYISLWDPGSVEKIMFNGGDSPVARIGDTAVTFLPPLDVIAGPFCGYPDPGRALPRCD